MGPLEETVGTRRVHILATVAMAASVWLLGIGVGQAKAAPVLAAECQGPPNASINVLSTERLAQTFTSQATGHVARGEIEITKPAMTTGDWTMEIFAVDSGTGIPTTPLAATTIADSTVLFGDSRIAGTFAPGVVLQTGVTYAISLTRPASWTARDRTDACAGREFKSTSTTGPWANIGGYMGGGFDLVFAVYVEPLPATPPASSTPANTGLRAAAIKKCKKKFKQNNDKKKFKKCKKKARALPI